MPDLQTRIRRFIEDALPWFDATLERQRNRHTEAISRRSTATRMRAERVIEEYRQASKVATKAGDRLVDEARRDR